MTPEQRLVLAGWLSDRTGGAVEITSARRIGIGHSKEMWYLETHHGQRLVTRVDRGGVFATEIGDEARWMERLRRAGVPIPRVVAVDADGVVIGRPLLVMEHVDSGGADGGGAPALAPAVADALIHALDRLHHLPDVDDGYALADVDQVGHWIGVARRTGEVPLLEEAAAWLVANRPVGAERRRPVHGDAGPGNLVHDGERVRALTDWELAHLGDPAEDWVYLAVDRGAGQMTTAAWRRRIAELTGWSVGDEEWRYWEALNAFKGACANLTALSIFEHGVTPSPDLLVVGTALHHLFLRRVASIVGDARADAPRLDHLRRVPDAAGGRARSEGRSRQD